MGVASRSRSSQSAPPSAGVLNVDGFSWAIDEPVRDMRKRAVSVIEDDVFLGDTGVHSRGDGSRVRTSQVVDEELSPGGSVGFTHTMRSLTGQSLLKTLYTPLLEIPTGLSNMVTMTVMKASLMLQYLHLCTPALLVVSVSEKTWFWICNYEGHPVTRRDESDITAVGRAALHHELR